MIEPSTTDMTKYPFLKESGAYLSDQSFDLEDFGTDPDLNNIVTHAHKRIIAARDGLAPGPDTRGTMHERDAALQTEVFSFLIAAVLVRLSGSSLLASKFSMREARAAEYLLERDLHITNVSGSGVMLDAGQKHSREMAVKIISDISGMNILRPAEESLGQGNIVRDDDWLVEIPDYLRRSVNFHERQWKLVNRRVLHGHVYLSSHETVRLIRREIEYFIRQRISKMSMPEMFPQFEAPVAELVQWSRRNQPAVVQTTEYPPCIKNAIAVLKRGENLPHSGRFMLAAYLMNKGMHAKGIAPLFKTAPDYNEKVTMYQLKNIEGTTGEPYMCPSCQKIKSNNLCFEIPECGSIINPIQFGTRRV